MLQTRHDRFVEALDKAGGLGVIFSAQTDNDCSEKLVHELSSVAGQQIGRSPARDVPIIHKKGRWVRQGYCGDLYGPGQFCISGHHDHYVLIARLRHG